MSSASIQRIAVIGGGVSGLAAAHRLTELMPSVQVDLYESRDRLGGAIHTERRDGFLLEHGADMFTTKDPWAVALCRRVGIEERLIGTNDADRRAFVVHRGRLCPVPEGFTLMSPARIWPVVATPILSPWGKLRLACEYFVPRRRGGGDESLAEFATRRLGREAYERMVQPLIGGIYTADPVKLSMQATMSQFVEMERSHGSLIRGMRKALKQRSSTQAGAGARYGMFVAPRGGMGELIEALAARLPTGCVHLEQVQQLTRPDDTWELTTAAGGSQRYDAVVVATPAHASARLLRDVSGELASELAQIPYASTAVVIAGYRREQIAHPLNGFGLVVPLCERRRVLSISFSSIKFAGRAPDGSVLLRAFVGGACQSELLERDDEQLRQLVFDELEDLLGVRGTPQLCEVIRWTNAMPQYHLEHLQRTARIEQLAASVPGLALAGNAYRGVGVPFCVHSGEQAAERLAAV